MSSPEQQSSIEARTRGEHSDYSGEVQSSKHEKDLHQPDLNRERETALAEANKEALPGREYQVSQQEQQPEGRIPLRLTKQSLKQSFTKTMERSRKHMSPPARIFSKVIHNPTIEKVSDIVGSTIARPDAILSGSFCALVITLALYLIARYIGFELNGSITIAAFIVGWLLGVLFDLARKLFKKRP